MSGDTCLYPSVDIKGVYLDVPGPTSGLPSAPSPPAEMTPSPLAQFLSATGRRVLNYLIHLHNSSPSRSDLSSLSVHHPVSELIMILFSIPFDSQQQICWSRCFIQG